MKEPSLMILQQFRKKLTASFSIEAAFVIPLFILYVYTLLSIVLSLRAEIMWQEAAYSAIQEAQLVSVFTGKKENTKSMKITSTIKEYIGKEISSAYLQARQSYWFKKNALYNEALDKLITDKSAFLNVDKNSGRIKYCYSYKTNDFIYPTYKYQELSVPYWGGYEFRAFKNIKKWTEKDKNEVEENIWSTSSFHRGKYFREQSSANLPDNFPVFAKFENGVATSVKSIDLTAPSYQDSEELHKRLSEYSKRITDFEGVENWGKYSISIGKNDIQRSVLHLIIPENSPEHAKQILLDKKIELKDQGIALEWEFSGVSKKYMN